MTSENGAADTNTLRSLNSEEHDAVPWKRAIRRLDTPGYLARACCSNIYCICVSRGG